MPSIEDLRLKTGQLITEDWFNTLCDLLNEIGYDGVISLYGYVMSDLVPYADLILNLGLAGKRFKDLNAAYGYFVSQVTVDGHVVLKDGDPITVSDFGATAEADIKNNVRDGLDASLDVEAIKNSAAKLDVNLSTRALESGGNLASIKAKTDNLDVAMSLIKAKTDNLDAKLSDIKSKTDNLDAKLSDIKSKTDNLDVALSTRALEDGGNLADLLTALEISGEIHALEDVTAAASATPLAGSSTPCRLVWVSSLKANSNPIRVGGTDVDADTGAEIQPGERVPIRIDDVQKINVYGDGSDKVGITYLV